MTPALPGRAARGASVRSFSSRDIRDIFALREVVEGLSARLASENVGLDDNRAKMEVSLEEAREIIRTRGGNYIKHNRNFHELIYAMAGNERVRETAMQLMMPFYQTASHQLMDPIYYRSKAAEHEMIAEAILDGDGGRAERMMRGHVRNAATIILDVLDAATVLPSVQLEGR